MATRLPSLLDRAILFAHRQTIESLSVALRLGATGLRADAWTTNDGHVVLSRTGLVRRFPKRRIRDVGRDAIDETFATLDELFALDTDVPLRLAPSDDETVALIMATARERGQVDRVWLAHHDLEVLARWRDQAADVHLVNSTTVPDLPRGPERRAAELAAARVDAVALPEADWTGGLVTLFHRFEVLAFADDAQFERQLARLIDMGVDAVSSDHADRMAAVAATFHTP
ncbi:MAG: hypothetical protein RIB98_10445 [Acidimicrobiales bacterium]